MGGIERDCAGWNDVFQGIFFGLRSRAGRARLSRVTGLKIGFSVVSAAAAGVDAVRGQIGHKMLLEAV